jgi:hypothetical protein
MQKANIKPAMYLDGLLDALAKVANADPIMRKRMLDAGVTASADPEFEAEGFTANAGPGDAMGRAARKWHHRRCI